MADITGFSGPGLIDEHGPRQDEAVAKPGDTPDYQPTEDDKKALKLAEQLFEKAKKHRAMYDQKWLDYYHLFRGKQWKEQRPSYRHSEVVNLIFRTLQSLIPIQVDSRPKFELLPEQPQDYELSQILNEAAESDWTKHNWAEQVLEVVYDSNLYGTGLSSTMIKDKFGTPQIDFRSADPFYCFPDPDARDVNRDCAYFCYAEPLNVSKIKKKYPDVKAYIKPDVQDMMGGQKTNTQPVKFRSPIDNKVILEGSSTLDLVEKDKALVVSVWISPEYFADDFVEVKQDTVDPLTGQPGPPEFIQQARYPNGRKITYCNGVLCEDEDNGYDDGEFPFERYPNYILPREFWGMSEIEQLEGPQKTFNKMVSFALDVLTLTGNPVWIVPTSSGIDTDNLVNRPGLVIEHDGGPESAPRREPGVQLQPYVLQLIEKMSQWFDTIGGSQDVTRGVQPVGVTAASAISSLQEAAQTRIRQKTRNMDGYLQQVGQHWVSRFFQFRTAPEVFRLTQNDDVSKYFKMHVEAYQADPATGMPVEVDPQSGQPVSGALETRYKVHYQPFTADGQIDPDQYKIFETSGKFDVKVSTGSALPFAKDQLENKLLAFFDRGIIDNEEVLKRSDYPNWQAVLQRMQQNQAQAQQAQQQQGGGGAPSGGGGKPAGGTPKPAPAA